MMDEVRGRARWARPKRALGVRALRVVGALAVAWLGMGPVAAWSAGARPESPRLERLLAAAEKGDGKAIASFWSEVGHDGAPLVEAGAGTGDRLVTFLYRSKPEAHVVVMADFDDYVPHMTMRRLEGTDVWYRSFHLPADARFLYELSVNDPAYPFTDSDSTRFPMKTGPDPLNPHRYEFSKPHILSLVELPSAPSLDLATPDSTVPRGVLGRFKEKLKSAILGNERDVYVYKPHGYSETAAPYPLIIVPVSYINQIRLPVILDNLIAHRRIPPTVAVFYGFPPGVAGRNVQDEEAGGGKEFGDFIVKELLPRVRAEVHVTTDPRRVIIAGASAGGNAAAFVGFRHPEAIGNVLAQSGAFWRGVGHDAAYWADPARDEDREGFARTVAMSGGRPGPVRFYLTIGRLERGNAFASDLITMVHATRHVRDVLQARGYRVALIETNGGHDPYNWEATLPRALEALLAPEPPARHKAK
jgi:enterochelin esterase-like enzyme